MITASTVVDRLFAGLLAVLPQHALSRGIGWLTRRRNPRLVQALIRAFIRGYGIDLTLAANADLASYPDFNAFFTRALRAGARPIDTSPEAIVSPVDAVISQFGRIENDTLLQAKGHRYRLLELLAGREDLATRFSGGEFMTLYLSPRDYHRIHLPLDGRLCAMSYIPGRLFAVNARTARARSRLFSRNERVVCVFDSAVGPAALIMVGAIGVGGIETVWSGPVTPAPVRRPRHYDAAEFGNPTFRRGDEIGRFNMGSTVILLFPRETIVWRDDLRTETAVRMGERIASLQT